MWSLNLLYSALFCHAVTVNRVKWVSEFSLKWLVWWWRVLIKKSSGTSKCSRLIWELKFTLWRPESNQATKLNKYLIHSKVKLVELFFPPTEGPSSQQEVAIMSAAHRAVLRGPFCPERFVFIGQRLPSLKVPSQSFDLLRSPLPRLLNWDFCPRYPPKLGPNVYTYSQIRRTTANECTLRKWIHFVKFCGHFPLIPQTLWLQRQSLNKESSRNFRALEGQGWN